jgi:hypothetical protein
MAVERQIGSVNLVTDVFCEAISSIGHATKE